METPKGVEGAKTRTVKVTDFLTEVQVEQAIVLRCSPGSWEGKTFARVVMERIILPDIKRINKALGQENDPMYLAFMVDYALSLVLGRRPFTKA